MMFSRDQLMQRGYNTKSGEKKSMGKYMRRRVTVLALSAVILTALRAAAGEQEGTVPDIPQNHPVKDETVYVIANPTGSVDHVIVNDWIRNAQQADTLADMTDLTGIENLKGEETWTENEDGGITWNAGGHDIYYQGTTDDALPVTVSVTFLLDGKEMTPEEIEGKSGEITIRYDYENNLEQEVLIGDKTYSLHVPFAAVTGMLLDENVLHDVQITNGCIVRNGDYTIAAGIAFPGLAKDLQTPAYASLTNLVDADVPDYVQITGQAENFTWNTTYTAVTNEIFAGSDDAIIKRIDEIVNKFDSLESAIGDIAEGVSSVNDGVGELKSDADTLAKSLGTLTENNEAVQNGAKQIVEGVLESVADQLKQANIPVGELTMDNYHTVLEPLAKMAKGEQAEKLNAAIGRLDEICVFYEGLISYTDGVAAAKEGADELKKGAGTLKGGTFKLFLETGILRGLMPDLSGILEVLKKTVSLGSGYDSFSGLTDGMDGKVRFIWKLEGI